MQPPVEERVRQLEQHVAELEAQARFVRAVGTLLGTLLVGLILFTVASFLGGPTPS